MKKLILITLTISLIPFNSFCQMITNYSLGNGYSYFKSNPKILILNDLVLSRQGSNGEAKMTGNPFFFRTLYEDQLKQQNSLLTILKEKNPNLAKEYQNTLETLTEYYTKGTKSGGYINPIFPLDWENNLNQYYKCSIWLTSLLETYSDYYKDLHNVNIEMELEQNKLNEIFNNQVDSIKSVEKQAFIKEKKIETEKLSKLQSDSNKFQNKYDIIISPIRNKYDTEIANLKKEEKAKIDQLPPLNFSSNKANINAKYSKLIIEKQKSASKEFSDIKDKFIYDNEKIMKDYYDSIESSIKVIKNLTEKIENIDSNLQNKLPSPLLIDQNKYEEKLNKIRNDANQKLNSIKL